MMLNAKDEFDLAFDKIKDLIFVATSLKPFKEDTNLLVYRKNVLGTLRQRNLETKKAQIATHVGPYKKMLNAFKDRIGEEDLVWLTEVDIELVSGGAAKNAKLPLSKIYEFCLKHDEASLTTIETNLYFIFKHLVDVKENPELRAKLDAICDQFEVEEDTSRDQTVSNIVNRVKAHMPSKPGAQPSMDDVTNIVKAMMGDGAMQGEMGGIANGLMSGTLTIPQLINQVKANVEAGQQASGGKEEAEIDEESDE